MSTAQPACRHWADNGTDGLTVGTASRVQLPSGRCRLEVMAERQSQKWPDVATSTTVSGWLFLIGPMAFGRQPDIGPFSELFVGSPTCRCRVWAPFGRHLVSAFGRHLVGKTTMARCWQYSSVRRRADFCFYRHLVGLPSSARHLADEFCRSLPSSDRQRADVKHASWVVWTIRLIISKMRIKKREVWAVHVTQTLTPSLTLVLPTSVTPPVAYYPTLCARFFIIFFYAIECIECTCSTSGAYHMQHIASHVAWRESWAISRHVNTFLSIILASQPRSEL